MKVYIVIETHTKYGDDNYSDEINTHKYYYTNREAVKQCIAALKERFKKHNDWFFYGERSVVTDDTYEFHVWSHYGKYRAIGIEIPMEESFNIGQLKSLPYRL